MVEVRQHAQDRWQQRWGYAPKDLLPAWDTARYLGYITLQRRMHRAVRFYGYGTGPVVFVCRYYAPQQRSRRPGRRERWIIVSCWPAALWAAKQAREEGRA